MFIVSKNNNDSKARTIKPLIKLAIVHSTRLAVFLLIALDLKNAEKKFMFRPPAKRQAIQR
jgi:hypothetical protein